MTDEEKKAAYVDMVQQLRKDLGIDKLVQAVDHLMAFNKPATEENKTSIASKMTEEEKKKLLDADNALDFIDRLGGILQKYNVIEGAPSDPFMKMQQTFAMSFMDLLNWQLKENMKSWDSMKSGHKT